MTPPGSPHPPWERLVEWWLGDTDNGTTEAIDAHLMQCDACGALVDEIVALSRGMQDAFSRGTVATVVSSAFVERLKAAGRRVREYRVPCNGSVLCSVDPGDEVLVSRLAVPLEEVGRLDAIVAASFAPGQTLRITDIPFDPSAGEVMMVPRLAEVRQQPDHELVVRLMDVHDAGERELGRYTFLHRAAY